MLTDDCPISRMMLSCLVIVFDTFIFLAPELGLLLGDSYYNPVVHTCYLRVTQHFIEWDEAEEQCKDYGMKLVAFETDLEIDFIIGLYNSGDHGAIFNFL